MGTYMTITLCNHVTESMLCTTATVIGVEKQFHEGQRVTLVRKHHMAHVYRLGHNMTVIPVAAAAQATSLLAGLPPSRPTIHPHQPLG